MAQIQNSRWEHDTLGFEIVNIYSEKKPYEEHGKKSSRKKTTKTCHSNSYSTIATLVYFRKFQACSTHSTCWLAIRWSDRISRLFEFSYYFGCCHRRHRSQSDWYLFFELFAISIFHHNVWMVVCIHLLVIFVGAHCNYLFVTIAYEEKISSLGLTRFINFICIGPPASALQTQLMRIFFLKQQHCYKFLIIFTLSRVAVFHSISTRSAYNFSSPNGCWFLLCSKCMRSPKFSYL